MSYMPVSMQKHQRYLPWHCNGDDHSVHCKPRWVILHSNLLNTNWYRHNIIKRLPALNDICSKYLKSNYRLVTFKHLKTSYRCKNTNESIPVGCVHAHFCGWGGGMISLQSIWSQRGVYGTWTAWHTCVQKKITFLQLRLRTSYGKKYYFFGNFWHLLLYK